MRDEDTVPTIIVVYICTIIFLISTKEVKVSGGSKEL